MRFDEIDFEDEVLDGLYDMNFEEMTPVQEATIPVRLVWIPCVRYGICIGQLQNLKLVSRKFINWV